MAALFTETPVELTLKTEKSIIIQLHMDILELKTYQILSITNGKIPQYLLGNCCLLKKPSRKSRGFY